MGAIQGQRIAAAADPFDDIVLYPVALREGLPKTSLTVPQVLTVTTSLYGVSITYKLHPNCVLNGNTPLCVFYVAYNTRADRSEFVVGPGLVDFFAEHAALYATAAGNFFGLTGYTSNWQISSGSTIHKGMNGNILGAFSKLGDSWLEALQDPGWWATALGSTLALSEAPTSLRATSAARINRPTSYPSVARALRTQENIQNLPITRGVQVLEQPTVFRHTITTDVPQMSFLTIQEEGALRLSTGGASAQYGEGVYAWRANSTGIGRRYIDIEVPAGTAAELLNTPSGSWYRLVPPDGNTLPVKIVGHNFTTNELAPYIKLRGR